MSELLKKFNINLDNNTLDQYESILSNFKNWPEYKREIKLSSLLEDKKIEFTLDISSHSFGVLYVNTVIDENDFDVLTKASASIKFMKFILKENNVLELEIKIKTLTTEWGKIINDLLESKVQIDINQRIIDNQVKSFYFTYPKMTS